MFYVVLYLKISKKTGIILISIESKKLFYFRQIGVLIFNVLLYTLQIVKFWANCRKNIEFGQILVFLVT